MSNVGQRERATQNREVAFFKMNSITPNWVIGKTGTTIATSSKVYYAIG